MGDTARQMCEKMYCPYQYSHVPPASVGDNFHHAIAQVTTITETDGYNVITAREAHGENIFTWHCDNDNDLRCGTYRLEDRVITEEDSTNDLFSEEQQLEVYVFYTRPARKRRRGSIADDEREDTDEENE